uniref:Ribosomal RNA-processing protein 7 C-terminal domain-containing protein n=1 Tax=Solanum tuberosum TaxID=4113 RepID=M1BM97_SOLTU
MEEKKRKKKRAHVLTRRRDEVHLSNYKDNVDGEKQNKSAKRKMRKDVRLDETESLEIDQSNEREDELGQENNVSAEKRKSRKKKRKSEKKVRRNETVDHYVEANDDSDQKSVPYCLPLGKPNDVVKIAEKDHSLTITQDNLVEKRGQAGYEEIDELSSGDEDCSKGMRKWVLDYYQSRPGLKVLQERIDEFITSYEAKKEQERKEKEALAAEDGWTVVVHHKGRKKTTDSETGIAVGSVSQAAVMDNMDKKKKKDVGLDFYRFQKREAKRNEIMVLQSKFEQDKKRIQQLRAARKFRPY